MKFSEEQIHRYSRQMILPGIGGKGQEKLAEAELKIQQLEKNAAGEPKLKPVSAELAEE